MLFLMLALGCGPAAPADSDPRAEVVDTDAADTDADTDVDTGGCREEGESCTTTPDDFNGDCCNSRHTCFPEGCFYSLPTG